MPLFFAMFKTLEGKTLEVELKNSLRLRGRLVSVDQYLNMKLDDIEVIDKANFPQLVRPPSAARCAPPCSPPSALPPHTLPPLLTLLCPCARAALCALALCARRRGALRAAAVRGSGH